MVIMIAVKIGGTRLAEEEKNKDYVSKRKKEKKRPDFGSPRTPPGRITCFGKVTRELRPHQTKIVERGFDEKHCPF